MFLKPFRGAYAGAVALNVLISVASLLTPAVVDAQQLPRESREETDRQQELFDEMLEAGRANPWTEISGEDVRGRSFWFEYQRRFPFDVVPAGLHKAAVQRMHTMRDRMHEAAAKKGAALFAANQWKEIGPTNVGGRVRALALHPTDPETIYVGGASGGVWKSNDGGQTWRTTFDKQTALTIGAIAIDPSNPNNVYVGTGELRVASDIGFMADGVFKSVDGGETWRNIGLNNLGAVSGLHVHRTNPNIIYLTSGRNYSHPRYSGSGLGSGTGFYRSTDAGATWTQMATGNVFEIAVNPQNNDELLISGSASVQRSTNAGETFSTVNSGLANLGQGIRMSMAFDPVTPTTVYLLQAYRGSEIHMPAFYKSTNSGQSWSAGPQMVANFFRTQGDYNNCIAVDPNDPDVILAGGIDLWRSTNKGGTWQNVTNTRGSTGDNEIAHPDQHIIRFDENVPGVVYIGNDGGVYQSFSGGASFRRLHSALAITQFHTVEIDQSRPYRIYGGTQDNQTQGGFGSATDYTKVWDRMLGGDGFWVVVDNTNPDIVYAESQYGEMRRIDANNLDAPPTNIIGSISTDGGAWSTPIAMSPVDNRLYTARSKVYRTSNPRTGTIVWEDLTPGFASPSRKATALSLSPFDGGKLIVANDGGDTRFTTDDGATWGRSTGLPSRFPTDLLFDPVNPTRVYAVFSGFRTGHVYVSNDNGATFTDISSNLPDVPANAIEIDPTNNSHLFVGTDIGAFVSVDGGGVWFPFSEGLPVAPVADMKIHRTRRVLIAATHGRSMFDVSIDNITVPAVLLAPVGGETVVTPGKLTVRWAGLNGPVNVLVSYHSGEPFNMLAANVTGTSVEVEFPAARSSTARIRVEEVSGGQSLTSGNFTLNAAANIETLGKRGFVAEGIAMRGNHLWATDRDSDTIRRLRLPLLTLADTVVRTGFTGRIRDLEYDPQADIFYALVTDDDLTNPRIFRMDTTGAAAGSLTLPTSITAASGITVAPAGLAVATPGENGRIVIVDVTTGSEVSSVSYAGLRGDWRRGLIWNGTTYTQGVFRNEDGLDFPSEIQRLVVTDSARLYERLTVIVSSGSPVYFADLAVDNTSSSTTATYYATDTAGTIYRFRGELFSGVEIGASTDRVISVRIDQIAPNPFRTEAGVTLTLVRAEQVTLELMTADGRRAALVYDGPLEQGTHQKSVDARLLASGVYYLVLSTASGERSVAPIVVTK